MVKKKRRIETRTALIIILILAIIGAGYVIFINLPPAIDYVTVEEINMDKNNFVNTTQTVIGKFDVYNGEPVIVSTSTVIDENRILKLNYDNIQNASDNLIQGEKYYFTGEIIWDDSDNPVGLPTRLILIADKFEKV